MKAPWLGGSNNEIVTVYKSFDISEGTCMKIGGGMTWIKYTNQQLNVSDSGIINNGQHTIGHPMIDYASLLRSGTCRTSHDDEDTIGGNDNCGNHTRAPTTHVDMNIDTFKSYVLEQSMTRMTTCHLEHTHAILHVLKGS